MQSATITAVEALRRIQASAQALKKPETRYVGCVAPTDKVRQGDVYFEKLEGLPKGAKKLKVKIAQLAPGKTRGSRHILTKESLNSLEMYSHPDSVSNPLIGPILRVVRTPVEVDHPDHGNVVFTVEDLFLVTYQRQRAEELRRVQD